MRQKPACVANMPHCFRGIENAIQKKFAIVQIIIARIKWCPVLFNIAPAKLRAVAVHSVPWVLILFIISSLPVDFARFTNEFPAVFG